ncbi:hypothetical protein BRADI_2g02531v3 [Brachypodium distachyon]|uniref:Uncharacterized protein n=1 Tax=Brachypodium distachyon TaxID=15368 RepID=A0A0Q3FT62_BRADI|nr:hypothetical protein BRADI_2g02531v3 [Brachypodium distachyon]
MVNNYSSASVSPWQSIRTSFSRGRAAERGEAILFAVCGFCSPPPSGEGFRGSRGSSARRRRGVPLCALPYSVQGREGFAFPPASGESLIFCSLVVVGWGRMCSRSSC